MTTLRGILLQYYLPYVYQDDTFKALYVYEALNFADLVFGDNRAPKAKDWVQDNQDILMVLKENLQTAQNQQKLYADRHEIERSFEVGDLVYLRL